MYFAVLGRHPQLSLAEFALVQTNSLRRQGTVLFFESDLASDVLRWILAKLGGIVKRWVVTSSWSDEMKQFLAGVSLAGVSDQKLGMELKKMYGIKRFKIVDQISSDLEVKQEGKECLDLGGWNIGLVWWRQDIAHFEQIDFWKPASGMEVGMMPAKLAQMLVNIGRVWITDRKLKEIEGSWKKSNETKEMLFTIYDPFCGFGTTGFVANRVGCNFIWSDLVIAWAKENGKRWKEKTSTDVLFTVFKHDVTEPFDHPVLQKVDAVVSEWRLWPVVSWKTRESELLVHAEKIKEVYSSFLTNIHAALPRIPIVITVPHYSRLPDAIFPDIVRHAVMLWYEVKDLGVYSRKWQEVCRQVVVLN